MEPGAVLLPHVLLVAVLVVVALVGRRAAILAGVPLVDAALLTLYVFGEDTYRGDVSRWDAYRSPGGALGPLFIASLVFLVASAAALAYSALRGRDVLFRVLAGACALAGIIVIVPVLIGFSAN